MLNKIESDLHKDAVTDRSQTHEVDLNVEVSCTLKEFMTGCSKAFPVYRTLTMGDGKTQHTQMDGKKEIDIKPGMKPGTQLRFVGEGHQPANKKAGDLVVTVN